MRWLAILVVLAAGAYLATRGGASGQASTVGPSPCTPGKQRCVVAYIAPWCPVCKRTIPMIFELRKRLNELDPNGPNELRIMVGADSAEASQKLAAELGAGAVADRDRSFERARRIDSFPTWLVLDASGKELRRLSLGLEKPEQAEAFLHRGLGL